MDLTLDLAGRSQPLGGSLGVNAGYGHKIWVAGKPDPMYGYLRGALLASTAGSYNSNGVELEVFPVSFIGLRWASETIQNFSPYKAYECDFLTCTGFFGRKTLELKIGASVGSVFFVGVIGHEQHTSENTSRPFVDPSAGLVLHAEGDSVRTRRMYVGSNFSELWSAFYRFAYAEASAGMISRMHTLNLAYSMGYWKGGVGVGSYHSSLKEFSGTATIFVEWSPTQAIGFL